MWASLSCKQVEHVLCEFHYKCWRSIYHVLTSSDDANVIVHLRSFER